ncbi:MAG: FecR domain-containing protein [Saprospiraceae bacterium]|nr:FecR domain-containing protein [Saprospiraceae bacterium]
MSSFESRLLDYLVSVSDPDFSAIRATLASDRDYDAQLILFYEKIWSTASTLYGNQPVDLEAAWSSIERQIESSATADSSQVRPPAVPLQNGVQSSANGVDNGVGKGRSALLRRLQQVVTVAAMLGAIAVLTMLFFENRTISKAASIDTVYILPDGSKVDLKAGSSVRHLRNEFFLMGEHREVYIEGDGTFDVVSMPEKPFYVLSDLTRVEVLGTIFKFSAEAHLSSAENIEGLVDFQVIDDTLHAELSPGDSASYDGSEFLVHKFEPPVTPIPPPPPAHTIGTADLVDVLGHQYPIRLEMAPYMHFEGTVQCDLAEPLDTLLQVLEQDSTVQIQYLPLSQGRYLLQSLQGSVQDKAPNYSYEDLLEGKPFDP